MASFTNLIGSSHLEHGHRDCYSRCSDSCWSYCGNCHHVDIVPVADNLTDWIDVVDGDFVRRNGRLDFHLDCHRHDSMHSRKIKLIAEIN